MINQSELDEPHYVPYVLIVSTLLTAFGMVIAFTWGLSGYLVENGRDRTPPIWPNSFGTIRAQNTTIQIKPAAYTKSRM